jgi:ATP-dependent Lon protease
MPKTKILPLLPLRDIVVFPHMIVPLFVGREKSVAALEEVMRGRQADPARHPEKCRRRRSRRPRMIARPARSRPSCNC